MRPKPIITCVIALTLLTITACSNPSLKTTVDNINRSYRYESKARSIFRQLGEDTDLWNKTYADLTKQQDLIAQLQNERQFVTKDELNETEFLLDQLRGIAEKEDNRLSTAKDHNVRIKEARKHATKRIEELKKDMDSEWSLRYIDLTIEINRQKIQYFNEMYALYHAIWDGSHLQIQVAEEKMALQIKALEGDAVSYNAAVDEWNLFASSVNNRIEENTKKVERLRKSSAALGTGIEKLENERSTVARNGSVRALFEKNMELADLK